LVDNEKTTATYHRGGFGGYLFNNNPYPFPKGLSIGAGIYNIN
jgi:hypothetical protein